MIDFLFGQHGSVWFLDILWQSGLFLMMGLAASLALHRRPARAHCALLLAIVASVVAPLGSQMARRAGWGLWSRAPHAAPAVSIPAPHSALTQVMSSSVPEPRSSGSSRPIEETVASSQSSSSPAATSISVQGILLGFWAVFGGFYLARVIVSIIAGWRIVTRARPITDGPLLDDARAASQHLGLSENPILLASDRAACPAIWCWGHRPVILLPETLGDSPVDWVGVFCHELAHWNRRDHLSSLMADVLTGLLPWHPLAWWARHRLSQLSELSCDDWAIASGREPASYAETLLNLVPRRRISTAMAAVSRRHGLAGRVAHIIESEGAVEPRAGRRWSLVAAIVAIGLVPIIALAQAQRAARGLTRLKRAARLHSPSPRSSLLRNPVVPRTVRGTVRDRSGRPIAGASIFAVGQRTDHKTEVLTRVSSDRDGKFTLDLAIDPGVLNLHVIAGGRDGPGRPEHQHPARRHGADALRGPERAVHRSDHCAERPD